MRLLRALLVTALVCLPFGIASQVVPPGLCQGRACGTKVDAPLATVCPSRPDGLCTVQDDLEGLHIQLDDLEPGSPGGGTDVKLDLGDDGGDDSLALSEIAIIGITGTSVATEPPATPNKLLLDFTELLLATELSDLTEFNNALTGADFVHRTTTPPAGDCAQWGAGGLLESAGAACGTSSGGGATTEAGLETDLTDVADVYTNADSYDIRVLPNHASASPTAVITGADLQAAIYGVVGGGGDSVDMTPGMKSCPQTNSFQRCNIQLPRGIVVSLTSEITVRTRGVSIDCNGSFIRWTGGANPTGAMIHVGSDTLGFHTANFQLKNCTLQTNANTQANTADDIGIGILFEAAQPPETGTGVNFNSLIQNTEIIGDSVDTSTYLAGSKCIQIENDAIDTAGAQIDKMTIDKVSCRGFEKGVEINSGNALHITFQNTPEIHGGLVAVDVNNGSIAGGPILVGCTQVGCHMFELDGNRQNYINTVHVEDTPDDSVLFFIGGGAGQNPAIYSQRYWSFENIHVVNQGCTPPACDFSLIDATRPANSITRITGHITGQDPANQPIKVKFSGRTTRTDSPVLDISGFEILTGHPVTYEYSYGAVSTRDFIDTDRDFQAEWARLWDADRDGSTGVYTCTAKDAPFPECKKAGEKLYPDFADDLNCAITGCGGPIKMEPNGKIQLDDRVVYINFPCWNIAEFLDAGTGDASNPTDRTTYDTAAAPDVGPLNHCPISPDGVAMRMVSIAGWQGVIEGAGRVNALDDTSVLPTNGRSGYPGTIIANDLGRAGSSYHGLPAGLVMRSISLGYTLHDALLQMTGQAYFTSPTQLGGYGYIALQTGTGRCANAPTTACSTNVQCTPQSTACVRNIDTYRATGSKICVCNSSSCTRSDEQLATSPPGLSAAQKTFDITSITPETNLIFDASMNSKTTKSAYTLVHSRTAGGSLVAGTGLAGACPVGTVEVELANGKVGQTTDDQYRILPPAIEELYIAGCVDVLPSGPNGVCDLGADTVGIPSAKVGIARSEVFEGGTVIRNLTLEPQDWWNEAGGDCTTPGGVFVPGTSSTDVDCDEYHLASSNTAGGDRFEDLTVKNWHHFGIDGATVGSGAGPNVERVAFIHGQGGPISDPGWNWYMRDITVMDTVFTGAILANFSHYSTYEKFTIRGVQGLYIWNMSDQKYVTFRDWRIESSSLQSVMAFSCGAQHNRIENFQIFAMPENTTGVGASGFGAFSLDCTDPANPIRGNVFAFNMVQDPGGSFNTQGNRTTMFRFNVPDGAGGVAQSIIDNTFIGNTLSEDGITYTVEPAGAVACVDADLNGLCDALAIPSDQSGCLFSVNDQGAPATGPGINDELAVLERQAYTGNATNGHLFCQFFNGGSIPPNRYAATTSDLATWCLPAETCDWGRVSNLYSRWGPQNRARAPIGVLTSANDSWGTGPPAGACQIGQIYRNLSGGAGTTLYICEDGSW